MYLLKKITALISAYLLFATSLAYANSSAEEKAAEIMRKVKFSKNEMLRSQLKEIGALKEAMTSLNIQIDLYNKEQLTEIGDHSLTGQDMTKFGAILMALGILAMTIGPVKGIGGSKDFVLIASATGASGVQYGLAEYADRVNEEQIENLNNFADQLKFAINHIDEDEVDPEALKKLKQKLDLLSKEQEKLLKPTVSDAAVTGVGILSALVNAFFGLLMIGISFSEIIPLFNAKAFLVAAIAIAGGAGALMGVKEGLTDLSDTLLYQKEFSKLSSDINKTISRLDKLTFELESQIK